MQVCTRALDACLIQSVEGRCGDDEVIFQDDSVSCHRETSVKPLGKSKGGGANSIGELSLIWELLKNV